MQVSDFILTNNTEYMETKILLEKGAEFSEDRKHRFALWRIWNPDLPLVMVIGLNPSTADAAEDDPTIESVTRLSKFNGYGGFYMMNCWSYISTDPKKLDASTACAENEDWLKKVAARCADVLFAWGAFKAVKEWNLDIEFSKMFPNAKCIIKNKDGSPGHPMYKKGTISFIPFKRHT